jgi:hypothetical protein
MIEGCEPAHQSVNESPGTSRHLEFAPPGPGHGTRDQYLAWSTNAVNDTAGMAGAARLDAGQAQTVRERVRLLIEITAQAGSFRKGLVPATRRLSREEATIVSDLERNGLQVTQLRDVLHGGHVLVDDPELYTSWQFAKVSYPRISSHHHDIDKKKYPDYGMRGYVVREKLHGRTRHGTWMQLEKTPAAFGAKKVPNVNDVRHLADYVIYRITRSNVGPWGLSRITERHPLYLSPDLGVPTSMSPEIAKSVAHTLHRIEEDDDGTAVSADLAARFPPPRRSDPAAELGVALPGRAGRGLFGNAPVQVTQPPSPITREILGQQAVNPLARVWPRQKPGQVDVIAGGSDDE